MKVIIASNPFERTWRYLSLCVAVVMLATVLPLAMAPPAAMAADAWRQDASRGIDGNYHPVQSKITGMVSFGGALYVGTEDESCGCDVWKYEGAAWTMLATGGFGERENSAASSLAVYGSHLYVATGNPASGTEIWRLDLSGPGDWENVMRGGFENPDNSAVPSMLTAGGSLIAGTWNDNGGCEVWAFDGDGWAPLATSGIDDPGNTEALSMVGSDGTFYVGTRNDTTGCGVYRYDDPGWTVVNQAGFGDPLNRKASGMALFGGTPAIHVITDNADYLPVEENRCGVYRFDGPDPSGWTKVNEEGFGWLDNCGRSMVSTGGHLYVGTCSTSQGGAVWRTDGTTLDSLYDWEQVNEDGFGSRSSWSAAPLAVHDSAVYCGASILMKGARLWRYVGSPEITTWEQVNIDGFTTNSGDSAQAMTTFKSALYFATDNSAGSKVWKYDGSSFTQVNEDGFGDPDNFAVKSSVVDGNYMYMGTMQFGGCEVWRYDGSNWELMNLPGFDDMWNMVASSMTVFDSRLHVTTVNYFAIDEDWVRCGVWRYDGPNPENWTRVNEECFGEEEEDMMQNMGAWSIFSFGSRLYVGTQNADSGVPGCILWSTDGTSAAPPLYDWTPANEKGFGDEENSIVYTMSQYGSTLYAGTFNEADGCQVWQTSAFGAPPFEWTRLADDGFGNRRNTTVTFFREYRGNLYAGTGTDGGQCGIWRTGAPGSGVWRSSIDDGFGDESNTTALSAAVFGGRLYAGTNNEMEGCQVWSTAVHSVNASVSGGNGTVSPASQQVPEGSSASVRITADPGYQIGTLTDNGVPVKKKNPYVIDSVSGDHDVVVIFTPSGSTWYLAEGTTAWGFSTYVTVTNPNDRELTARITYMDPSSGPGAGKVLPPRNVKLPPLSQTTLDPRWDLGDTDFSTRVECLEGLPIAADRTMFWTGEGAPSPGGHNSIGTSALSRTWYLPEGSSAHGFETWTLVANPNDSEATVTLAYMTEGAGARLFERKIPAFSRATYSMADDIGPQDSSVLVTGDLPVVAERSQYRDSRREGSCSIGSTAPAAEFFLAEGTTAWGFTTYVLVQNPGNDPARVTVTYMTPGGPAPQAPFTMPPRSRKTIRVNEVPGMENTDLSTLVAADRPVIAERAMYWGEGTPAGEAFHASVGLSSPHAAFHLPDGQAGNGYETWTLVANPNPGAVKVRVTYLTPTGMGNASFTDEIPPGSRRTYPMSDRIASGRASVLVESLDAARPVMAERSMYWNSRGAGTASIGGHAD